MQIFAFLNFWFERKIGSRIFFWPIGVPKKNYKFSKNIEKNTMHQAPQITLFLNHPCYVENRWSINDHNYFFMNWLPASSSNTRLSGRGASSISNFNWCSIYLSINQSISIFSAIKHFFKIFGGFKIFFVNFQFFFREFSKYFQNFNYS